ncbi:MAG: thermonuclease family protein [Gallionellaceae bacterium]
MSAAQAAIFTAKVIAVMDGDTVMVLRKGQRLKIRLANIDAPEKAQAFGPESRDSLQQMVGKKQVQIDSQAVDQYGRIVGTIFVNDLNANEEQVRRGLAWEYSHYHSDKGYIALEKEAKQARRGLWAQSHLQPPWKWRKAHPSTFTKRPKTHKSKQTSNHAVYDPACGNKKNCGQMSSCAEANFYLTHCGLKSLDENKNGEPCEKLCRSEKNFIRQHTKTGR